MKWLSLYIRSNMFIATAAIMLTFATQVQIGLQPQWHPYIFIVFFATFFDYNLHRLITLVFYPSAIHQPKHQWVKNHKIFFITICIISAVGLIVSLFLAKPQVLWVLAPMAIATALYSLPVITIGAKKWRLREVPFLKIFLIAWVWSGVTVLLPVVHLRQSIDIWEVVLIGLERFLFVFAITIPFDIRDMEVDLQQKLTTLPIFLGKKNAAMLTNCMLLAFLIVSIVHYTYQGVWWVSLAIVLTVAATLYALLNKKWQQHSLYYYGILDGTMLLLGVLIVLFHFIKQWI